MVKLIKILCYFLIIFLFLLFPCQDFFHHGQSDRSSASSSWNHVGVPWVNLPPDKSTTTLPISARLENLPFLSTTDTSSCFDSRPVAETPLYVNTSL